MNRKFTTRCPASVWFKKFVLLDFFFPCLAASVAPINPGSIPSVGPLGNNANANANRTSIGGGISPVNFNSTQVCFTESLSSIA